MTTTDHTDAARGSAGPLRTGRARGERGIREGMRLRPGSAPAAGRGGARLRADPLRARSIATSCPTPPSLRASVAATRPPSPTSTRARSSSTSAPVAASTCCSPRAASAPTGKAYGLDMTEEMLALARAQRRRGGRHQRRVPARATSRRSRCPAGTVDVVISNCVINLSTDKPAVFAEIVRVLRPGGRIGDQRRRGRGPPQRRRIAQSAAATSAASPVRSRAASTTRCSRTPGCVDVSITFTHSVADGLHGAIVKATKPGILSAT